MTQSRNIGRSKAAKSRKAEIAFHSDSAAFSAPAYSFHAAINVKVQNLPYIDAPEEITAAAYDQAVESFWQTAGTLAVEAGYSGAFSEGRSNGWLVPFTQHDNAGKLVLNWTGQGPEKGYPVYPSMEDAKDRRRFLTFRAAIEGLMQESIEFYQDLVASYLAEVSE
jgi:hypothetical protein